MKKLKKELTCFYSDGVEYQTCQPIAEEAKRRGYSVKFTDNKWQKAEIGLYCQHVAYPQNSRLSMVMLHDMAQQHGNWPNIWRREPWNIYDVGILPGPAWEQRWQQSVLHPFAHPRLGVIRGGWPKADRIFRIENGLTKEDLKKKLGLTRDTVILYAPSWEYDGKQDEFVRALMHLDADLILKQAPWSDEYNHILENIRLMNEKHRGIAPNVHIINPDENIFDCIKVADVMVSDESSVMFEGLLLNVPAVAVTDWMIPDTEPARYPSIPYDFVLKTEKSNLRQTVEKVLNALEWYKQDLQNYREQNFYDFRNSSGKIMDAVDQLVENGTCDFIQPHTAKRIFPVNDILRRKYLLLRRYAGKRLRKLGLLK